MASKEMDAQAKTFTSPEGQANLYVVRPGSPIGGAISFQVIVDGKVIGSIAPGSYYLVVINPGKHSIAVTSNENSAKAKLDAEAGKNYFFSVSAQMGLATARAGLDPIEKEADGRDAVNGAGRAESLED